MKRTSWRKCNYGAGWGDLLVDGARKHPAKYPRGPLEKLADYGLLEKWWRVGDLVVDPMAGVGCGGIVFSSRRVRWWGLDVDRRYVSAAVKVFDRLRHNSYFYCLPMPEIACGDAKELSGHLGGEDADAIVMSPPYAETLHKPGGSRSTKKTGVSHFHDPRDAYGAAKGQVGSMKMQEYVEAMSEIYAECHKCLKRRGILVVNIRNYVRKGRLVRLSQITSSMIRGVGFKPIFHIRCMMDGHGSMFRRMNKARNLPISDYDHFLIFRKGRRC